MPNYDDIINLPRPKSKREAMAMRDRAAQFSPFAALNGHEDAISETARRVAQKTQLSEEQKGELDRKTLFLLENPNSFIEITYFIPDRKKQGGAYVTTSGRAVVIDVEGRRLIMSGGEEIAFDDVLEISGELFDKGYEQN